MRVQIRNRVEKWNIKTSAFISVVFHLLLLFTAATLFSDPAVRRTPIRFVKVALYPLDGENKPIPEQNPPLPVKHHLQRPEKKEVTQEQKQKEPVLRKEFEPPVPLPVQSTVREIPAEDPPPREEEKSLQESPPITVVAALNPDLTLGKEELQPPALPPSSEIAQGKNLSDSPSGDGRGVAQEDSDGGGPGDGSGPGRGGFYWKGFGKGNGIVQRGSDEGGPGGGAGRGTGSGQGDGHGSSSRKGAGFFAKLFSSSDGSSGVNPRYVDNPKPPYPQEARERGYQGEVLLRVEVLSNGRVGQIEVKHSSGYDLLDRSALNTVKQWKFVPAKKREEAVSSWVNIPIKFQLQ